MRSWSAIAAAGCTRLKAVFVIWRSGEIAALAAVRRSVRNPQAEALSSRFGRLRRVSGFKWDFNKLIVDV